MTPTTYAVQSVPLDALHDDPQNPMVHDNAEIQRLVGVIGELGFIQPIAVDAHTMQIIAGHGRVEAARSLGMVQVPAVLVDDYDDVKRKLALTATNGNYGHFDDDRLAALLGSLQKDGADLDLSGLEPFKLEEILGNDPQPPQGSDGSLLALTNVTIAEPTHQVAPGDIWTLSGRHTVLCVDVLTDWPVWRGYLSTDDAVFCPYPGPLIALGAKADDHHLVMVQPDPYVAGHILDRYADINGPHSVSKA